MSTSFPNLLHLRLVLALSLALYGVSFADTIDPSHPCRKPIKPYEFKDEWEIESFKDDVDRYKRCIEDFVEEQEEAIEAHQNAASEAVDDWNRFVKYEL